MNRVNAFTLIELLVVVTIIVVLLAILTPAMDRAIGQAELAVCGANLKSVGAAAPSYALNHRRYYFYRAAVHDPSIGYYMPRSLNVPFNTAQTSNIAGYDDRPIMAPYLSIDGLQCPPADEVSLEGDNNTYIEASYSLWVGWRYTPKDETSARGPGIDVPNPENPGAPTVTGPSVTTDKAPPTSGMFKLGDKLRYANTVSSVLAGDTCDVVWTGWWNSHPDKKGVLVAVREDGQSVDMTGRGDPDAKRTRAGWYGNVFDFPGRVDMNFAWDDGSVRRLTDMYWDSRQYGPLGGSPSRVRYPCPRLRIHAGTTLTCCQYHADRSEEL
jgi:prepilin-type N-terminal cleavage/methylation domain-containing protein